VLLYTTAAGGGDPAGGRVTHLRRQGEADPIRIAEGRGEDLSPDASSALVLRNDGLYDVPVGAGVSRRIDLGGIRPYQARFVPPDASRVVVAGRRDGSGAWLWLVPRAGGPARPLGPESRVRPGRMAVGPRFVAVKFVSEAVTLIPLDGGPARDMGGLSPTLVPAALNSEDGSLFLYETQTCELETLDPATGKVRLFRKTGPADRTGLVYCGPVVPSSDGRAYAYSFNRSQADVILAEGLR
jgi:hypothetical protein